MKIVIIGNPGVGKSCLLLRFCENSFSESYFSTIGVDFRIKPVNIDGTNIKLQIWDTAGQERFQTITTSYYHNANGIAVVYDVTDRESFEAVHRWFNDAERLASPDVCKLLIGNKNDLNTKRAVTEKEGRDLATSLGVTFLETSAKTADNVDTMFVTLGKFIKVQKFGRDLSGKEPKVIKLESGKQISSDGWCSC